MKKEDQTEKQGPDTQSEGTAQTTKEKKFSANDLLRFIGARTKELWHDPNGEPYVTIRRRNNTENYSLHSEELRSIINRAVYLKKKIILSDSLLDEVLKILGAQARYEGKEYPVHIRCAYHESANTIYVDLCDDRWEAIEIDENGYRLAEEVPVKFRRSPGMAPLPHPKMGIPGKALKALKEFLNLPDDNDHTFALLVAFLVGTFNPLAVFPLLGLIGGQGSGKSTMAARLGSLVDPSTVPTRAAPKKEEDLIISADNSYLLNFDNLSGINPWQSDAFCRLATKSGFRKRKLYTDRQEVLSSSSRPIIVNGIVNPITRNDLADRSMTIDLPSIPEGERKTERELKEKFRELYPMLLGALYSAVSTALRNRDKVVLPNKPRMADFAVWVTAAEEDLPFKKGLFMEAYTSNRLDAAKQTLEDEPLGLAILEFMDSMGEWTGSMTELQDQLHKLKFSFPVSRLPRTPKGYGDKLRRLAPVFRRVGIDITWKEKDSQSRRRLYRIINRNYQEQQAGADAPN